MEYLQYYSQAGIVDMLNEVLNLIINGIPSIHPVIVMIMYKSPCFKPYYKWNTFNTLDNTKVDASDIKAGFKPYYKWNTFNTPS